MSPLPERTGPVRSGKGDTGGVSFALSFNFIFEIFRIVERAVLALAAAFFLGLAKVFVNRGLAASLYPTAAAVVSLSVNTAFFLTLTLGIL